MTKQESGRPRSLWLRIYTGIMEDPKVMQLPCSHFKTWLLCLCMAKEGNGTLPSIEEIAFKLRVRVDVAQKHIDALIEDGLIDRNDKYLTPHNWDKYQYASDVSTERVERFRERKRNVSCNGKKQFPQPPQRTEYREQSIDTPQTPHAFDLELAFEELWNAYPAKGRTRKPMSQQYYVEAVATLPDDQQQPMHARILAPVLPGGKWAKSSHWAKGFVQGLPVYLNQTQWLESPEPEGAASSAGAYDHLPLGFTQAEKEKMARAARERAEDGLA